MIRIRAVKKKKILKDDPRVTEINLSEALSRIDHLLRFYLNTLFDLIIERGKRLSRMDSRIRIYRHICTYVANRIIYLCGNETVEKGRFKGRKTFVSNAATCRSAILRSAASGGILN